MTKTCSQSKASSPTSETPQGAGPAQPITVAGKGKKKERKKGMKEVSKERKIADLDVAGHGRVALVFADGTVAVAGTGRRGRGDGGGGAQDDAGTRRRHRRRHGHRSRRRRRRRRRPHRRRRRRYDALLQNLNLRRFFFGYILLSSQPQLKIILYDRNFIQFSDQFCPIRPSS